MNLLDVIKNRRSIRKFQEKQVSKILKLPKNLRPIIIVPVGFPADNPSVPPRASKSEAVKIFK